MTNRLQKLVNTPVPNAGKILRYMGFVALFTFVFLYGVLVGLYRIAPWESVKPLVQFSDQAEPREPAPLAPELSLPPLFITNLLNFDIHWINPTRPLLGLGGGLVGDGSAVLVVKAMDGRLWRFEQNVLLPTRIQLPQYPDFPETTDSGAQVYPLRYNDVLLYGEEGSEFLLATHGHYDSTRRCRTIRLSRAALPPHWRQAKTDHSLQWDALFTAEPCLAFLGPDDHITAFQEGGALLRTSSEMVLFTVGDFGKDGTREDSRLLTQRQESDYGRVLELNLSTDRITRYAMGLRNPQGLTLDSKGRIWALDHGPQGGDELNLIQPGKNYGWPLVTYGVNYTSLAADSRNWPHQRHLNHHDGYEQPKYTWTPSVAPSGITTISAVHPSWNGDLLISSLAGKSLIRLGFQADHVIAEERLFLGQKVRDVLSTHGRIYFLLEAGVLGYLTPRATVTDSSDDGALTVLRNTGCLECHANPGTPSLDTIYGQPIADQPGVTYSKALRNMKGVWNQRLLADFLLNPQAFAPGTSMPAPSVSQNEIVSIISALEQLASP